MESLPLAILLRVILTILAFLAGWAGAVGLARRWLRGGSAACALAGGFLLWNAMIVFWGVALCSLGLFHRAAFLALPLLSAAPGFYGNPLLDWGKAAARESLRALSRPWGALGIFAIAGALMYLAAILAVYPGDGWDTYQYHHVISLLVLQEGRLSGLPSSYYPVNTYPKNNELLVAWLLGAARWEAPARLLPVAQLLALLAAVFSALRAWRIPRAAALFLAAGALAPPVIIHAALAENGNVDIAVAAGFLTGAAAALRAAAEPVRAWRQAALAALAAAYLLGVKGNAALYAAALGALAAPALRLAGISWRRAAIAWPLLFLALAAPLSSYWMIANWRALRNPLGVARISIGEFTVFPGEREPEELMSVQAPEKLQRHSRWTQFRISLRYQNITDYYYNTRLGGWGAHYYWIAFPLWIAGMAAAAARRRFWTLWVLLVLSGLFYGMPSNWWARYVLFFLAAAPLCLAPLLEPARFYRLRAPLLALWGAGALFTLSASLYLMNDFIKRPMMWRAAREAGRAYLIPQDAHHAHWPEDRQRDLYRWFGDHLPAGARVGYSLEDTGFPALLFRPDYRNTVREVNWARPAPLSELDYLALHKGAWPRADAYLADWAPVYENSVYIVFQREAEGRAEENGVSGGT